MNEVFRELSWDVASPKKEVFVDLESWLRVTQVREVSEEKSQNVVYFLSMLRPDQFSRFGGAIFLGANIEDSRSTTGSGRRERSSRRRTGSLRT